MTKAIAVYSLMMVIGLLAPIILAVIWKLKTKAPVVPIIIGAVTFFTFAIILESIPKQFLFSTGNPVGSYVMSNTFLYMSIAAMLAGLFEETGRFVAYKFILKKYTDRKTAISYGIGHGGFEVIFLMGIGAIQYVIYAIMIQTGQFDQIIAGIAAAAPDQVEAMKALPDALMATSFLTLLFAVLERISAVLIHISCSIIMFRAVRCRGKIWLYPIAILLHMSIDMICALYASGILSSLWVLEIGLLIWAIVFFLLSYKLIYTKLPRDIEVICESGASE